MAHATGTALKHFINNQKTFFDNAQCIENAIALHEKGKRIDPSISLYTKLYADLVERSAQVSKEIAQNGAKIDPAVLKAHRELDAQLSSLSLRVAIASEAKLGLSKGAKMGCYALAAGIAAAAAYYLYKTWPTEETMKRVFDLGLGVKEEVLETSRCVRAMAWNRDITRTCVTTRSTVNPDSLNQWLAGTKTCIDTVPSSFNAHHLWCPIPLWDPAEKSELLRKGQRFIAIQEFANCSTANGRPFQVECSMIPKDSPFRTIQAKTAFEAYQKLVDRQCQEHACQRLDESSCASTLRPNECTYHPFAQVETQNELLEASWNETPYPQTSDRVRVIARETALFDARMRCSDCNDDFTYTMNDEMKRPRGFAEIDACIKDQGCDQLRNQWENAYCVKTKCAKENSDLNEKLNSLPTESGKQFWASCSAKIEELCPPAGCELSDRQICEAAETCHGQLMNLHPDAIKGFAKSTCHFTLFWR